MTITNIDDRSAVTNFTTFPLNAVVAIDSQLSGISQNSLGSGITIAPNYVLTAGHNAFLRFNGVYNNIRTTTSSQQPNLISRTIGANTIDPGVNVSPTAVFFPRGFNTSPTPRNDIALFRTNDAPIAAANTVGLLAFVSQDTANGLSIVTAGYPSPPPNNGRTLVLSPGTSTGSITSVSNGKIFYSANVDTERGQSGSGIWHVLAGDTIPRVLGIHTDGYVGTFSNTNTNNGTVLTTDLYDLTVRSFSRRVARL